MARRIRAAFAAERMELIAMTGYGQPEDRRRALQAGFDSYLVKPVDPAQLGRLLAAVRPGRPRRYETLKVFHRASRTSTNGIRFVLTTSLRLASQP